MDTKKADVKGLESDDEMEEAPYNQVSIADLVAFLHRCLWDSQALPLSRYCKLTTNRYLLACGPVR